MSKHKKSMGLAIIKSILISENVSVRIKEDETNLRVAHLEVFFGSRTKLLVNHGKANDHCES